MNCPACSMPGSVVTKTIIDRTVTRRRLCGDCGALWTTDERLRRGTLSGSGQPLSLAPNSPVSVSLKADTGTKEEGRPSHKAPEKAPNSEATPPKYSPLFSECWKLYGRGEEKDAGFVEWRRATKDVGSEQRLRDLVVGALAWQGPLWAKDNWKYAVYFHRYLKRKKYNDERPGPKVVKADTGAVAVDRKLARINAVKPVNEQERQAIGALVADLTGKKAFGG